jgi:glucose-1-phosphate adenylyltransferase
VLFANVTVEEGANVKYSIVMPGTTIKKGATVQYSIVAENAVIEEGAVVGASPEDMQNIDDWGVAVIGHGVTIGKGGSVPPKAMIDEDIGGDR